MDKSKYIELVKAMRYMERENRRNCSPDMTTVGHMDNIHVTVIEGYLNVALSVGKDLLLKFILIRTLASRKYLLAFL